MLERLNKHWTSKLFWFVMMMLALINTVLIVAGLEVSKVYLVLASFNLCLSCLKWCAEGRYV